MIRGDGILTPELQGRVGWTHLSWMSVADLVDLDVVSKAKAEGLTEEQMAEFVSPVKRESNKDQILPIVHLGGSAPESSRAFLGGIRGRLRGPSFPRA